jgi:hypothetical protein
MAEEATEKATRDGRGTRSRREVLAGAAGALGVLAAQTLGKAIPAQAGVDGDVVLGVDGQPTSGITGVTTSDLYGLHGESTDYVAGTGVYGQGGLYGVRGAGSYVGVQGAGDTGVKGYGEDGNGVFGQTSVNTTSGVYGQNDGTGYGVAGRADDGTGVLADSANGTALQVSGKAVFSRSGKATVKAGNSQVVVKNVALTPDSLVLATLQQVEAGIYVAGVVLSVANSKFTISLSQAPTGALKVAWFIVN